MAWADARRAGRASIGPGNGRLRGGVPVHFGFASSTKRPPRRNGHADQDLGGREGRRMRQIRRT
jgi:hypothetical protein